MWSSNTWNSNNWAARTNCSTKLYCDDAFMVSFNIFDNDGVVIKEIAYDPIKAGCDERTRLSLMINQDGELKIIGR